MERSTDRHRRLDIHLPEGRHTDSSNILICPHCLIGKDCKAIGKVDCIAADIVVAVETIQDDLCFYHHNLDNNF